MILQMIKNNDASDSVHSDVIRSTGRHISTVWKGSLRVSFEKLINRIFPSKLLPRASFFCFCFCLMSFSFRIKAKSQSLAWGIYRLISRVSKYHLCHCLFLCLSIQTGLCVCVVDLYVHLYVHVCVSTCVIADVLNTRFVVCLNRCPHNTCLNKKIFLIIVCMAGF